MIAEHLNTYGTKFKCYDDTILVVDSERYMYHIVNLGGSGMLRGYVDCYHVTEAVVAAPSYQAAIDLLTNENLGAHASDYTFEVNLIGADMKSDESDRFIMLATKPSLE